MPGPNDRFVDAKTGHLSMGLGPDEPTDEQQLSAEEFDLRQKAKEDALNRIAAEVRQEADALELRQAAFEEREAELAAREAALAARESSVRRALATERPAAPTPVPPADDPDAPASDQSESESES